MKQVRVKGLTKRQVALCDQLWSLDTPDEILNFLGTLKGAELDEAIAVMNLLLAEYIDGIDLGDCAEARAELARISAL